MPPDSATQSITVGRWTSVGSEAHAPRVALRPKAPQHLAIAALLVTLAVTPAPVGAQATPEANDRSKELNQIFLDFPIASRALFPIAASANGWRGYDVQFTVEISEEHRQKQREWCGGSLKALAEIDCSKLSEHDGLSYNIFGHNVGRCLERLGIDFHLLPIEQSGWSVPATFPILGSGKGAHPFRAVREIFVGSWPKSTDPADEIAAALNTRPKFVASRTLDKVNWPTPSC